MELNADTLNLLVGVFIPLLVGLVSKEVASSGLKGVLNALLSAVAGVLVSMSEAGGVFILNDAIHAGIATFVTSIATYYGIWKPTGVAQKVQDKTAQVGIGSEGTLEV